MFKKTIRRACERKSLSIFLLVFIFNVVVKYVKSFCMFVRFVYVFCLNVLYLFFWPGKHSILLFSAFVFLSIRFHFKFKLFFFACLFVFFFFNVVFKKKNQLHVLYEYLYTNEYYLYEQVIIK